MLSPELLQRIRRLQIRTAHLVTETLAGEYQSTFKGRGMEFEEVRVYVPGDDVRNIDWNTTARTATPHIKSYREERELTVMLLVDVSGSELFGSAERTKNDVAAEVAAILANTAMRKNDKVGAILFSDVIEEFIPPKKGRSHVWRVVRGILTHEAQKRQTKIAQALDYMNNVVRRRSVVFLISDFLDSGYEHMLAVTRKRHDLIAVTVRDPRERDFPSMGYVALEDAENGRQTIYDSTRAENVRAFQARLKRLDAERIRRFNGMGIDHLFVETHRSTIDPIIAFFHERMRTIRN